MAAVDTDVIDFSDMDENESSQSESDERFKDSDGSDRSFCFNFGDAMYSSNSESETSEEEGESDLDDIRIDRLFWHFYSKKTMKIKKDMNDLLFSPGMFDRVKFIIKIMKAFEFGPDFDAFCFTLPRPVKWESSFKERVIKVKDLLHQCKIGFVGSVISDFPSTSSKDLSQKSIRKLQQKLKANKVECQLQKEMEVLGDKEGSKTTTNGKEEANNKGQKSRKRKNSGKNNKQDNNTKRQKQEEQPQSSNELEKNIENDSDCDDMEIEEEYSDMSEKEFIRTILDTRFPRSIIYMVSDGTTDILSSWCGQFQVTVNPVTKTLSVLMYDFTPNYPKDVKKNILNHRLSPKTAKMIGKEVERLECSRQLRMDVPLKDLKTLFVVQQGEEMIVYSRLIPAVKFYQRFIHVGSKSRNDWTERQTFLPFEGNGFMESSQEYMLVLGGPISEMSDVMAIIMECNSKQRINYSPTKYTMPKLIEKVQQSKGIRDYSTRHRDDQKQIKMKVDIEFRNKILNVLKKYGFISKTTCEDMKKNIPYFDVKEKDKRCNFIDLDVHPCFKDFLNFECDDIEKLEKHLKSNLDAAAYAYEMKNLNLKYPESYDLAQMTVADFLKAEKGQTPYDEIYYSFCFSCPRQDMCEWHCKVCRKCDGWRTWHCKNCDKCTYGVSNATCEHCGFKKTKNQIVLQPYSYYHAKLMDYSGTSSQQKLRWNVQLSTTDVPKWEMKMPGGKNKSKHNFELKEYLCWDDLGFLNLWNLAFMLDGRGPRQYVNRYISQYVRWNVKRDVSYLYV